MAMWDQKCVFLFHIGHQIKQNRLTIKQFYQMDQEIFLRDDMIEFTSRLDSENYNVKAFRKRNSVSKNKTQKKIFVSSECDLSELLQNKPQKYTNKTQRTTQMLSAKRLSSTSAVKKRSQINQSHTAFIQTARTKNNSCLEELSEFQSNKQRLNKPTKLVEIKDPPISKFNKQERQISKGGQLKHKHFENWLNQIILQYCQDQKFDSTIENPALKKYGIDKNSLLSKGINPQIVERLYKSLFVYSMGFNTLLTQLCGKNMTIRKIFWKVYAILLEYCSSGDFDTMIGQIERDKIKKMEAMKQQIEKRQQIIENNDQINQQKNAKIFKQLKILKQENVNLQNDKIVLLQDYKQAEQAFNEEVSLRLRFQNKINQIHGVHRQLGIKHQRLYEDLQAKTNEVKSVKQKLQHLTQQNSILKNNNAFMQMQNENLKEAAKFNANLTDQIKRKYTKFEMQEIEWKHGNESLTIQIREKQKNIDQIKNALKNAELMIKLREQSQKQLQKEYKRSLEENKQLVTSLQKQLVQINSQMLEKKQFQEFHSRVYAEVQFLKTKIQEKTNDYQKKKAEMKQMAQNLNEKESLIEILEQKNQQLNSDIKDCYKKIQEMKKIKTEIEENLIESKNREEIYKNYYLQKQAMINTLNEKVDKLERSVSEFNINKKMLQSKLQLVTQKLLAEEQMFKKKIEKLKDENVILNKQNKAIKQDLEIRKAEQQRYMVMYQQYFHKLKNQMFERNDLQLRYKQSLTVVQSETDHIKNLNIKISQVQERNEEHIRKIRGLQFIAVQKEKTHQIQLNLLNSNSNQLINQIKNQKYFIHPMKYQELLSQYQRLREKNTSLEINLKKKVLGQTQASHSSIKMVNLEKELAQVKLHYEQILQQKNSQLFLQRQTVEAMKRKLQNISQQISNTKNGEMPHNYNFRQQQIKYLQVISQKTKKIEQIYKQIQSMHDHNNTLIIRVSEAEDQIKQQQQKKRKIQHENQSLLNDKDGLINQKLNLIKQQQRLSVKLIENQMNKKQQLENGKYISNEALLQGGQDRHNQHSRQKSSREEEKGQKAIQPGWRNDFAKKMRNATNYYKK